MDAGRGPARRFQSNPQLARAAGQCLLALLVSACASSPRPDPRPNPSPVPGPAPSSEQDYAPTRVPEGLENIPDPVPRPEPRSRYGNPASYEVRGKRYYVMDSANGYKERGFASWYGSKFHGRRTSSGETYDMFQMTAAHKSLPLPTYVRDFPGGAGRFEQRAEGYAWTVVNGEVFMEDGEHTGALAGQPLGAPDQPRVS